MAGLKKASVLNKRGHGYKTLAPNLGDCRGSIGLTTMARRERSWQSCRMGQFALS